MLVIFLALTLSVDVILYLGDAATPWPGLLFGMTATVAVALFAFSPAAAATSLVLITLLQVSTGSDGSNVLYLAFAAGLVVYTSPLWFVWVYTAATVLVVVLATTVLSIFESVALPPLALVVAVSASIGWGLRAAHRRERRLADDLTRMEEARAAVIAAERERIADELHDIIAHDITLVSMHARVLERVDDAAIRERSVHAIRTSADQALSDIRRMLRIVRDDGSASSEPLPDETASLAGAMNEARESLSELGAHITVRADEAAVSSTIEQTLVHLIREGTTNIAKHAPARPVVAISLEVRDGGVHLEITNSLEGAPTESDIPSAGYGLDRLRERVSMLGGRFSSEESDGSWTLSASLPAR